MNIKPLILSGIYHGFIDLGSSKLGHKARDTEHRYECCQCGWVQKVIDFNDFTEPDWNDILGGRRTGAMFEHRRFCLFQPIPKTQLKNDRKDMTVTREEAKAGLSGTEAEDYMIRETLILLCKEHQAICKHEGCEIYLGHVSMALNRLGIDLEEEDYKYFI